MGAISLLCRLLLAGAFAVAAAAKLADRTGSSKAFTDFGLPGSVARQLSVLLPLVELVVAVLLVLPQSGLWGGLSALVLLLAFTIGIGISLARGRTPDCHCFGQLHSAPVGWPTLMRNTLLAGCAGVVALKGRENHGLSVLQGISALVPSHFVGSAFGVVVFLAFVAQGWLIFHLLHQHGRILLRLDSLEGALRDSGFLAARGAETQAAGLAIGSSAPSFEIPLLSGEMTTLVRLCEFGNPVLLVFSDPGCNPCSALLPDIARWERDYASILTVALISRGSVEANRGKTSDHGLKNVLLQQDREVAEKYRAVGTPSAVLIHSNGSIGSPVVVGPQAIAHLVANVTGQTAEHPVPLVAPNGHHKALNPLSSIQSALQIGQSAPSFRLSDLNGSAVELHKYRGHNTLLLFWNPNCGFCKSMLLDFKAWERNRPKTLPEVLVISTGSVESNRAMQLQSTILLDQSFGVGTSFGASGTPSAILIDSTGNIASAVAVGAASVLALAATEPTSGLKLTGTSASGAARMSAT